jgi:hypothetical protein
VKTSYPSAAANVSRPPNPPLIEPIDCLKVIVDTRPQGDGRPMHKEGIKPHWPQPRLQSNM